MQLMKYCSLRIKPARVCNTLGLHAGSRLICAILLYNMAKIGLPDPPGMRGGKPTVISVKNIYRK